MPTKVAAGSLGLAGHDAGRLTAVHIDAHNGELRDEEGFIGDRAIGIGCPGLIREDGSIEKGGQNLPGDWERA